MRTFVGKLALAAVSVAWLAGSASAVDPPAAVKKTFEKMLAAVQAGDRDAFVADATDAVKKGTTKEIMDAFTTQFGTRLKKGYEVTYLTELKQAEHQIHLWKLTFKEGDDVLVRMAFKDGKVGGFFLQ